MSVRWWQYMPCRYVFLAESCFTVFLMTYMASISPMSVAAMIKRVTVIGGNQNDLDVCPVESTSNETYTVTSGEFVWDGFTQTMVLSGSSIGMFMSYLVSARLCEIFGVKRLVGYAFLLSGILNCLQPTFLGVHVSLYIIGGLIHGLLTGIVLPGFSMLFVRWLEEKRKTKDGFICIFGTNSWNTLCNVHGRKGYHRLRLAGSILLEWNIVITIFHFVDIVPIAPWRKILTSSPYWAHISVSLAVAWISFTIGTELPLYLTKVLNFNIEQTSVISALPHLAQLFGNIFSALLSQFIRDKGYLTKIVCYKVFNIVATVGPAIMMIIVPQLGCNHVAIIAVLSVAMLLNGAYYGGSFMNHLELSANYAGSTSAFASTISSIISFCAPLLANLITDENTLTAWNTVFYTSAILTSLPVVIFLIFGSTEEQYWNKLNFDSESRNSNVNTETCKQAILVEKLQYVGEDSANNFGLRVPCGQHNKPSRFLFQFSRLKRYLFIQKELEALVFETGTSRSEASKSDNCITEVVDEAILIGRELVDDVASVRSRELPDILYESVRSASWRHDCIVVKSVAYLRDCLPLC
uniref:(California timema) hypothetical protein n=1 Tax=Timema californicum TaxID=61474 RepID=A0A7R9J0W0_TIMCA|nr:unnamed protein product [Timema californicum]